MQVFITCEHQDKVEQWLTDNGIVWTVPTPDFKIEIETNLDLMQFAKLNMFCNDTLNQTLNIVTEPNGQKPDEDIIVVNYSVEL